MRRHLRRVLKHGTLALAALLLIAAIWSARASLYADCGRWTVSVTSGRAHVGWAPTTGWASLFTDRGPSAGRYFWWFDWYAVHLPGGGKLLSVCIPVWFPAVLSTAAFLTLWRRDRRLRLAAGLCKRCGYHLAGLAAEAPCPECGRPQQAR